MKVTIEYSNGPKLEFVIEDDRTDILAVPPDGWSYGEPTNWELLNKHPLL
jgi:hypothetical protein